MALAVLLGIRPASAAAAAGSQRPETGTRKVGWLKRNLAVRPDVRETIVAAKNTINNNDRFLLLYKAEHARREVPLGFRERRILRSMMNKIGDGTDRQPSNAPTTDGRFSGTGALAGGLVQGPAGFVMGGLLAGSLRK
jgi:hypothetical protein